MTVTTYTSVVKILQRCSINWALMWKRNRNGKALEFLKATKTEWRHKHTDTKAHR